MPRKQASHPTASSAIREAFRLARFTEAGRRFDEAPPSEATSELILLRARIALKTDASSAIAFLLAHRESLAGAHARFLFELYLGIGFSRLREFMVADQHFLAAASVSPTASKSDRAELAYHRARRYLLESRPADAWQAFEESRVDRTLAGLVRSETLQGFIHSGEGNYHEQAASLERTLDLIGQDVNDYLEDWYCAVHTLSVLARELARPSAKSVALREIGRIQTWSPDFATQHLQSLRALGWCNALSGDSLGCFRFLREAQGVAESIHDSKAWRVILHLDRAHFARLAGEYQWAENEFSEAQALARNVEWERTTGEERVALLLFAELLAPSDSKQAMLYLARFNALDDLRSPLYHFSFDGRLRALADAVRGVVHVAAGNLDEAASGLKLAWSTFDRIGYDWRAGKAAMALTQATGKTRWHLLAIEKLEQYPQSWLYGELRAQASSDERSHVALPPMQERVLALICEGLSTDAIAEQLQRSRHTVRNHIKLIFKAYGVRTRAALVAKAASHAPL